MTTYDIIMMLNVVACVICVYLLLVTLSRSRKKLYEPPSIRRNYIVAIVGFLSIPSLSLGAFTRIITLGFYKDSLIAMFATIACVAMLITSFQFLRISVERDIYIRDKTDNEVIKS